MVNSSACCSELTRAYNAARSVSSMTLGPPGAGARGVDFATLRTQRGATRWQRPTDHRPDVLVSQRPQLVFQPMSLEAALQSSFAYVAAVLHNEFPQLLAAKASSLLLRVACQAAEARFGGQPL